jgi:hypothetical protein
MFDVGRHSGTRPEHARTRALGCPRAHAHVVPASGYNALMHDHLPCRPLRIAPRFPELTRSSGDLPATRQSRPP